MNSVLTKVIFEYTSILKTEWTVEEKNLKIQELSFLLHNELYSEFVKEMTESVLEEYEFFIKTADKFLSKIEPQELKVFEENDIKMISFKGQKKPLMNAYQIASAFLESSEKSHLFLFTIFLSNDEDILKMNLIT
jgi:hypothetical protein